MPFVYDTFTDTAGIDLTAHTGEKGATWTEHGNYTGGQIVISDANRCRGNAAGASLDYASGTPPTADYPVKATFRRVTSVSGHYAGVVGRSDTSGTLDAYLAVYSQSAARWELYKSVAGTQTLLAPASQALADGTDYELVLDMVGTTIRVLVDGAEVINVTNGDVTQVGVAGIETVGTTTNTTGYHLDNFRAGNDSLPTPRPRIRNLLVR